MLKAYRSGDILSVITNFLVEAQICLPGISLPGSIAVTVGEGVQASIGVGFCIMHTFGIVHRTVAHHNAGIQSGFVCDIDIESGIEIIVFSFIIVVIGLLQKRTDVITVIKIRGSVFSVIFSFVITSTAIDVPYPVAFAPVQIGIQPAGGEISECSADTSGEASGFAFFQDNIQDSGSSAGFKFRGRIGDDFDALNLVGRNTLKCVGTVVDTQQRRRFSVNQKFNVGVSSHRNSSVCINRNGRYIGQHILQISTFADDILRRIISFLIQFDTVRLAGLRGKCHSLNFGSIGKGRGCFLLKCEVPDASGSNILVQRLLFIIYCLNGYRIIAGYKAEFEISFLIRKCCITENFAGLTGKCNGCIRYRLAAFVTDFSGYTDFFLCKRETRSAEHKCKPKCPGSDSGENFCHFGSDLHYNLFLLSFNLLIFLLFL